MGRKVAWRWGSTWADAPGGREAELALLHARWAQAQDGLGQVVVLSGEPGIGKSRLVQALHEHLAAEPHVRMEWRCVPDAQQSPLQPVIAHLHRLLRWRPEDTPETTLRTLEATLAASGVALPEVVPLLAALLSLPLPTHYPPLALTPQRQRHKTLEALLAWLLAETTRHPCCSSSKTCTGVIPRRWSSSPCSSTRGRQLTSSPS